MGQGLFKQKTTQTMQKLNEIMIFWRKKTARVGFTWRLRAIWLWEHVSNFKERLRQFRPAECARLQPITGSLITSQLWLTTITGAWDEVLARDEAAVWE